MPNDTGVVVCPVCRAFVECEPEPVHVCTVHPPWPEEGDGVCCHTGQVIIDTDGRRIRAAARVDCRVLVVYPGADV